MNTGITNIVYTFTLTATGAAGTNPATASLNLSVSAVSYQIYSGTSYRFNYPTGIAVDGSGNVWVTNDSSKGSVTELKGVATPLPFKLPLGQ